MRKYLVIPILIVLFIIQLLSDQLSIYNLFQPIIIILWAIYYLNNLELAIFGSFILTLIYEIYAFKPLGQQLLIFNFSLIIVAILQNVTSLIRSEKRVDISYAGLLCNTSLFFIVSSIISRNLNLFNLIASIIANLIVFSLIVFISKRKE